MSLNINLSEINYLAVLVTGIIHMVANLVWFLPKFFGKAWAELTQKEMKPAPQWIWAGVVSHLLVAFTLAILVNLAGATTILGGIVVAALAWLGFVVTLEAGELIWEKIPFKLFLIRVGNQLVSMCLIGAILAVW
jgi:hypothetical protein